MRVWLRFAISFFVLCIVIVAFAYFFGPGTYRQQMQDHQSPIGQLNENHQLSSPGQGNAGDTSSATTSAPSSTTPNQ